MERSENLHSGQSGRRTVFLSAGETSGDVHGGAFIAALRALDGGLRFTFIGGPSMARAAGCAPLIGLESLSVMGFWAVIKRLPQMAGLLRRACEALDRERPAALVVIDFPTFNLKLARHARQLGIPVYFYVSPKVWAWKSRRMKALRALASRMLCILPFEPAWLEAHGMAPGQAVYVGNPSVEEVDSRLEALGDDRLAFIARHNLTNRPLVALVPGSRLAEIRSNLPVMVGAVAALKGDYQPVIAGAPGIDPAVYTALCSYPVVDGDTLALMRFARAALVTSGTATLECALAGTPQVVLYRANGSRMAYSLMRRLIKVDHVSLPNLILNKSLLPELLLHRCTAANAESRLRELLDDDSSMRRRQLEGCAELRRALGTTRAAVTAATLLLDDLGTPN